ncbi:MAG: S-methyl-5-thioribose-1-phosphate isomerase [Veillonella sp.]|nr:S-methyl-5-thioribose-1-phosphate isomerase [Veillonella sp.]MCF0156152.1 S-methyl-5-thioribose-1-phosphate isomerase [Veillonella sp.]
MESIKWTGEELVLLDQTKLPTEIQYLHITDWRVLAEAIKMLRVRGAPAIGISAAYGLVLAAREAAQEEGMKSIVLFRSFAEALAATRPTAINLMWAVNRMVKVAMGADAITDQVITALEQEAKAIHEEDKAMNVAMGQHGASLFQGQSKVRILTHCNAGALATGGWGTALGVVRELHKQGQLERVYADETRPLLQGARLTAFELKEDGIPVTLQTDNMAAYAMQQGLVDAVIVGADRITTEGDVANKIGTYGLAVLAKHHGIPFYVAAPYSTFDFTMAQGQDIPIEMRNPEEVWNFYGVQTGPEGVDILNPAFDVTPHDLVTAIITEQGVLKPDYVQSIAELKAKVEG